MPVVTVTRRLQFNAAHRVHNPALSDEENVDCSASATTRTGTGTTTRSTCPCAVPSTSAPATCIDLSVLKRIVEERAVDLIDHKNFNLDVAFMRGVIPTSENIIVGIWRELEPAIRPGQLVTLVLWETPNNYVEYTGE
jgi:6-pyruvoyltetrahydropterin/6-carboxytetrahydropterin synthase